MWKKVTLKYSIYFEQWKSVKWEQNEYNCQFKSLYDSKVGIEIWRDKYSLSWEEILCFLNAWRGS